MSGKQVRLFLVDGTVGGLMTAEILNWTGHMLRARRKDLTRIKNREEAQRTGVYVLFGTDEEGEPAAYIGEGDSVVKRLDSHNAQKEGLLHGLVTVSSHAARAAGGFMMVSYSMGVKRPRPACRRRRW